MADDGGKNKRRPKSDGGLTFDEKRKLWIGYVYVYGPDGKRRQIRVASKLKSTALQKLDQLRSDLREGREPTGRAGIVTVGDWLDEWLRIQKADVKPSSYKSCELTVRRYLKPHIGTVRLAKLTPAQVRATYAKLQKGTPHSKPSTRNAQKAHQVLSQALGQAVKDGRIKRNVCDAVNEPKHRKQTRGAFETAAAYKILRTAAARDDADDPRRPKLASRWVAAFMTGARQAELLGLEWDRVDLNKGVMDISWQLRRLSFEHGCGDTCGKQRPSYCPQKVLDIPAWYEKRNCHLSLYWVRPKTDASERLVPMAPLLLESLRVHLRLDKDPNPYGLVWHHRDGRPISQEDDNEQWNMLMAATGVEKTAGHAVLHEARNTAATLLLESGADAKVIKDILGHSSILQTQEYQRVGLELSKSAVANAFDALLPKL